MPIDKQLILEKLSKIDEYVERIKNMHFGEDQFLKSVDYQDLITFRLQQAVEISIDIATHLIAALNLEKPETARSSFEVLAKHQIINEELAKNLSSAVSFRNLAVHGYEKFDFRQLFYDYKDDLKDLKQFIKRIIAFLDSS